MAIMVGTGRGAAEGILIRDAEALETFEKVNTLVVDKTVTLTERTPRLTSVVPAAGLDETQLLQVVASLEKASEHPLAAAILVETKEKKVELLSVTEFQSATGKGVTGQLQSKRYGIGNAALMADLGASADSFQDKANALQQGGLTQ